MNSTFFTHEATYKSQGQQQLRDDLILEHLDYVQSILGKTIVELPHHIDRENLESAGVLGLVEAAQQFDPSRGVEFKTFAYRRIRGAILDELRRNSPLPQRMMQMIAKVRRACEHVEPPVTPEEIARHADMTLDDVEASLAAMRMRRMQAWEESEGWLLEIADARLAEPDAQVELRDAQQCLAEAIEQLPENERLTVTLYYLEDLRLREIGEVLNLSESRVSRLLSKAEFRLGQIMNHRSK